VRLSCVALALVACGGSAPPVKSVTVAPVTRPTSSAASVAPPSSDPKLALAYSQKVDGDVRGIALASRELYVNVGGALRAFDTHGPVASRRSTWRPGDPLLVVGDGAFDPVSLLSHAPSVPKNLTCESRAFSYGGARMSADCSDASGAEITYVYDTRTSALVGKYDEFHTAAPIRQGAITASGRFVFWSSRASGAFEEISSHVVGPEMSSRSTMSRDESMVFTTVDRRWYTDDRTPARVIDPHDGRTRFTLGTDVDAAWFSPSSRLLAVRHSKNWADLEHATEHDVAFFTIHDATGALLARVAGSASDEAVEAAFSPDDGAFAVRFATGVISVYDVRR